jgi:hypothetical protein
MVATSRSSNPPRRVDISVSQRRTWVPWTLVVALMILTAGSAVFSASTTDGRLRLTGAGASSISVPTPKIPFTGFGGYDWFGRTTSISGQWAVPTILGDAQGVAASTWIGAQSASSGAFIQIGITENRLTSAPPEYEAFWSDTSLHYDAQPIQAVGADDTILASMRLTPEGWDLAISDLTAQWGRTIDTEYGRSGHFTQGEWLQEDPPPSLDTPHDEPYPATTLVQFTDATVNGHVPTLPYQNAQTLSGFGGIYLVPTAFSHDGFTLPQAQGAARQYLADATQCDLALQRLQVYAINAHKPPSQTVKRVLVADILGAYTDLNSELLSQSWPTSTDVDIQYLVRSDDRVVKDYQASEATGFKASAHLTRQFVRDSTQLHLAVDKTRAQLGLPPI